MAEELWRGVADHAAGYGWDDPVSGGRAGLGGGAVWAGQRCDSKDLFAAGDEYIAWLLRRGRDSRRKRLIASDGLDVDEILRLHAYFDGRRRFSAGGGT